MGPGPRTACKERLLTGSVLYGAHRRVPSPLTLHSVVLQPRRKPWKFSYPNWCRFAEVLGSGASPEALKLDDELQEVLSAGIEAVLSGPAAALSQTFDFAPHRRLLDVGGGTGSWSIVAAKAHPHLWRPPSSSVPNSSISPESAWPQQDWLRGSTSLLVTPWRECFPPAMTCSCWPTSSTIGHPEGNRALLQRVRSAAEANSRLLLADFWTNPTHTEPLHAALMAGEFAVHVHDGDVYSVDEVRGWLSETGWRFVEHAPLVGPQSLIVAEAA